MDIVSVIVKSITLVSHQFFPKRSGGRLLGQYVGKWNPENSVAAGRCRKNSFLQGLLQGNTETVTLNERVIYSDIGSDKSALYTLLLTTGYLTISQASPIRRNRYELRIPNKEIKDIYGREILNYLAQGLRADNFDDLFDYLFRGDVERFTQSLQHILRQVISTYDAANKESFTMASC